ncbi:hypothetical protein [Paraflavitalea sp. CAU 1676]|uniref:hypothetical protein n=1 Tax=Paraflavitalea sp. CAU 1676 TaxID=3032598 RepID=UPI0023DA5C71|nr:hypothetical protein [Paraflavitalea sp. CAU 1676]MDF2189335.1 hypothetical protein [Paraflavitalea sp. CAU 1676]
MITMHEVRLGSRVRYLDYEVEITGIDLLPLFELPVNAVKDKNINWTDLSPITINSSTLHNIGFQRQEHHGTSCFQRGAIILIQHGDHFTWQNPSDYTVRCALRHLHQLQNLYYALTGDELLPTASISPFAKYRAGNMVCYQGQAGSLKSIRPDQVTWVSESANYQAPESSLEASGDAFAEEAFRRIASALEVEELPATATMLANLGLIDNQRITGHEGVLQVRKSKETVSLYTIYGGVVSEEIRSVSDFQNLFHVLTEGVKARVSRPVENALPGCRYVRGKAVTIITGQQQRTERRGPCFGMIANTIGVKKITALKKNDA